MMQTLAQLKEVSSDFDAACTKYSTGTAPSANQLSEIQNRQTVKIQESLAGKKIAHDCSISTKEAYRRWKEKELVIVDVRRPSEYAKYRIPMSINIPLYAIKTKPFLKQRHIVLVDEGLSLYRLATVCQELKSAHFEEVKILDGGINAWAHMNGELDGQHAFEQNQISPSQFLAAKDEQDWVIVDITSSPQKISDLLANHLIIKTYADDVNGFRNVKQKTLKSFENHSRYRVMVVSDHGDGYAAIKQSLRQSGLSNVFNLKGGVTAYEAYIAQLNAMLARQERGPTLRNRCGGS